MANSPAMSQSRRRPKRQRTPTTIYTDDNPTTFTTKKKKGENNGQDDKDDNSSSRSSSRSSLSASLSTKSALPSTLEDSPSVGKRGPGRPSRRKSVDQATPVSGGKTRASAAAKSSSKNNGIPDSSSSSSSATTPTAIEKQPSSVVTKRKRGRPPKNRPKEEPDADQIVSDSIQMSADKSSLNELDDSVGNKTAKSASTVDIKDADPVVDDTNISEATSCQSPPEISTATKGNTKDKNRRSLDSVLMLQQKCAKLLSGKNDTCTKVASTRKSNIKRRTKKGTAALLFRARANSVASCTPPQQDIEGNFIDHSVTVAPILPPVIIHDNDERHVTKTNEHGRDKPGRDNGNACPSLDPRITSRELESKYPVVFDKGVPRGSSSLAAPFSSNSQISSSTSTASSKHKFNQSQHQLSQLPTWSPLYDPPVFFEDDYDQETGNLDIQNMMPVTRHVTAMAVRKPDHDYLVLGDSVGFVTIYCLSKDNINLPIAQLESVACQQRGKLEQDRLRADLQKRMKQTRGGGKGVSSSSKSKYSNTSGIFPAGVNARPGTPNQMQSSFASRPQHVRSILIDTSDTTIHALGMIENRVVLATREELECMDVPSGTSLWVCPLSSNRFVNSLDMHLKTFDVLVSCSKTADSQDAVAAPISPLMLLQHSKNNVEICDANSPMLIRSPSCTAIWDVSAQNRLLFIALSSNRQEHELVLVSGGSIDSWKVACKTKIPAKTSSGVTTPTKLSQSAGGEYTLVASARGIRLYQTESLQLIHVYGDQLALHGQSVVWKDCWLAGSFISDKNKNISKAAKGLTSQWLQCEDWLGGKIQESSNENRNTRTDDFGQDHHSQDETSYLAPYILGVPHTKGPKELCENLHVWKVEHPSVVPTMSIPLPHKAEGALGLVGSANNSSRSSAGVTEDRIVLVTKDGKGHLLLPKMESNFAGIAYPPGYQVVTDNIEFIEDEDATDQIVSDDRHSGDDCDDESEVTEEELLDIGDNDEVMDEEMREAMRQSLLEHKKHETALEAMKYDAVVDILGTDEGRTNEFLPCRPEPYLRQMIDTVSEVEEQSENEIEEEKNTTDLLPSGKTSGFSGIDGTKSSKIVASKPKLTGAIFVSKVLEIMPNMPKPKPLEEDCLSFTTTKVVVAVNPVLPTRPGRGKKSQKSRAANLESMLRSSINPYLQSMMLSRQGVAVNGQGSRLRFAKNGTMANSLGSPDNSANQSNSFGRASCTVAQHKPGAGTGGLNSEPLSNSDSSAAALDVKRSISPRQATNDDEAAVVMGLLGLSPCHTTNVPSNALVSPDSKAVDIGANPAHDKPKGSTLRTSSFSSMSGKNEGNQVFTFSSDLDGTVQKSEGTTKTTLDKARFADTSCSACRGRHVIHSCGKRSLPIDYEEIARVERERKEKMEEEKKRIRAEKRRLADQKRREAKKQKQRELEEQRIREERERIENQQRQRLREDFASQDLNRQRREQIVASYASHVSADTSGETHATSSVEYGNFPQSAVSHKLDVTPMSHHNDSRQNTLPQNMDNDIERISKPQGSFHFHQSFQPRTNSNINEQHIQTNRDHISKDATSIAHKCNRSDRSGNHFTQSKNGDTIHTTSKERIGSSASTQSPLAQVALPSVSATLGLADALLGLANLAEYTKDLPVTESHNPGYATPSNEPERPSQASSTASSSTRELPASQSDAPAVTASHGFGVNVSLNNSASYSFSSEVKRGIPSYATIRSQFSNGSPNDVASAMDNSLSATASFSNGYSHKEGQSQTYSWFTRSGDHGE